jgi:hypothetical protein
MIKDFLQELRTQRWDDHRYYHHSRINQSLHFVSAASFLFAYAMLFIDPMVSALVGWLVSMTSRQAGHFFFEPRGYDHVNQATHEHKEEIKVGYNLQRKVVLMSIWALSPLVLYLDPTLFGLFEPWTSTADFMRQVAKIWLAVGIGGLLFRTVHLFFIRDVQTGLVWMLKILTDPRARDRFEDLVHALAPHRHGADTVEIVFEGPKPVVTFVPSGTSHNGPALSASGRAYIFELK